MFKQTLSALLLSATLAYPIEGLTQQKDITFTLDFIPVMKMHRTSG